MSLSRLDIKTLKYDSLYDDTQILLIENIKRKVEEVRRERISKLYSEMLDLSGYRVEEGQTDFHALSPRSEHHTHTHTLRIGGRAARWCQPLLQRGGGAEGRHALWQKKKMFR